MPVVFAGMVFSGLKECSGQLIPDTTLSFFGLSRWQPNIKWVQSDPVVPVHALSPTRRSILQRLRQMTAIDRLHLLQIRQGPSHFQQPMRRAQ